MNEKLERMKELIEKLNLASKMYYQDSNPIMTDYEYDRLYDELVELEKETNKVFSNSPTINVETEVSKTLEKYEHKTPMLSLSKTKQVNELINFIGDKDGVLSWKLDGLTIVLTYNNGKLIRGVTRGNGTIGEVVTENVKQFKNIPLTIPYKGELVVRGEAIIKYSDFEKMNGGMSEEEGQFKNPRNLCSGSVRQLNPNIVKERNINCIIFALISASDEIPNSVIERFKWLENLGFEVVERLKVNKNNLENSVLYFKEKIASYDIPSDGLVLTFDDTAYGLSLGVTAKYPRNGIAFKWKDETVRTTLRNIEWSASRTGLINPVAIFDPVLVEGTIVSRASVHNISIMKNLKLGIGDTINVFKANMIIPQIASDIEKKDNIIIPKTCPICNHETEIIDNNGVKYLSCPNEFCHAKFIKKLSLFTSRNAMNIDGISEQILTKLFKENMVNDYCDLYHLNRYKDEIINFEGFGPKSYDNIIKSIEKSRKVKLANFIYALGISEIGLQRAKLICNEFDNNIDRLVTLSEEELASIDGIGDVIAKEWVNTFNNEQFKKELDDLLKEVMFTDVKKDSSNLVLKGKIFVITGSLEHYENRDKLVEYIESLGGKASSSVSAKTSYLINNDITSTSGKNKKAKELGVPIITEEEFINMVK